MIDPYKKELFSFLLKSWPDDVHGEYAALLQDRLLYVTSGKDCVQLNKNDSEGISKTPQVHLDCNEPILLRSTDFST